MDDDMAGNRQSVTRRVVLQRALIHATGAAGIVCAGCTQLRRGNAGTRPPLRIGLVTDVHYADKEPSRTRRYRDSAAKLSSAIAHFNESRADFVVELGDFIDAGKSADEELSYLRRIEAIYGQARCPQHHVLGNHCVHGLTNTSCPVFR